MEGTLFGDEAAFALTTERMATTGDWVVPYITDTPHLNATPLYNWLTLLLGPWSDGSPFWHRLWSGAFGVACVLTAFALGTLLFSPEIGLVAGLLLTSNRGLLFDHGIRFGGMDAMLTFFVGSAIFGYAWLLARPGRPVLVWAGIGVCIGLACLSKPPVFGGIFFALIVLHWLYRSRRELMPSKLAGPLLALALVLFVAGPWYLSVWSRLGHDSLHALFVHNSVERTLDPGNRPFLCCHGAIWHASKAFRLTEVAFACGSACWWLGHRRQAWGLLLFLTGGYLLALSVAGKGAHYVFYPFPLLAVLLAGLFLEAGPYLIARLAPRRALTGAGACLGLAIALIAADAFSVSRPLLSPAWQHPPMSLYRRLAHDLERERCRLVLLNIPSSNGTNAAGQSTGNFEDWYYHDRTPLANRVRCLGELTRLL